MNPSINFLKRISSIKELKIKKRRGKPANELTTQGISIEHSSKPSDKKTRRHLTASSKQGGADHLLNK